MGCKYKIISLYLPHNYTYIPNEIQIFYMLFFHVYFVYSMPETTSS